MKSTRIIIVCLFFATTVEAQTYPMLIKAGETKQLTPTTESLFVLQTSQMKAYQDSVNELEFARKKISLLDKEIALQLEKEKILLRDTSIYADLYHRYYNLWDATDHKLEASEIKLARTQHTKWNLGFTGMLIGVIATLLIVK